MENKIHVLKTWTEYYQSVVSGKKTFELRKDDRGFSVGDRLDLMEYLPNLDEYTGDHCHKFISYILKGGQFGLEEGYVILGLADEPINQLNTNKTMTAKTIHIGEMKIHKWDKEDVDQLREIADIIQNCEIVKQSEGQKEYNKGLIP